MADTTVAAPAATAWGAVLGGWVATIGASVIFAPLVAGMLAAMGSNGTDLAVAVPVVLGILVSYVVGGYVAGRMAGYRTSWHGLVTAFFSLLILLLALLVGAAADRGMLAGSGVRSLADIVPGARDLNIETFGNAVSFGAILGFLAAIFGGWFGGLLAPTQRAVVGAAPPHATPAAILGGRVVQRDREAVRDRDVPARSVREAARERPARMLPSFGRKGGERSDETGTARGMDEVHTSEVDRTERTEPEQATDS